MRFRVKEYNGLKDTTKWERRMIDCPAASGERRTRRPTLHGILNSSQLVCVKLNDCKVNHTVVIWPLRFKFYMQLKLIPGEISHKRRLIQRFRPLTVTFCLRVSRRSAVGDVWLRIDVLTNFVIYN